ncbi:AzlD domain-containing protein [Lonsdalea quercina]|uniref:AzlD domain-containing protein n=1 Tax=Lonsdalea quercina TaxID=71657 RepID=UPI0039753D65
MSWSLLFVLAGVVFFNRYLFLDPRMPVTLPLWVRQALRYSAPCMLTAICGPVILLHHHALRPFPGNPYLWGALGCVIIALLVRNVLLAVACGLAWFYALCFWLGV